MKPQLYDKFGNSIKQHIPPPSEKLIDQSELLTPDIRKKIINLAAKCVDQNTHDGSGRASMCQQFAILVKYMLQKEDIKSKVVTGQAEYRSTIDKFPWKHYWVETDSGETIDCNIDSIIYLGESPDSIEPYNYWGNNPIDRTFYDKHIFTDFDIKELENDDDETLHWKNQIDAEY